MVAEHVEDPTATISALNRLIRADGKIIVYTVSKFSAASLIAAATPTWVHHVVKRYLWWSSERDNFPTFYRMNTRKELLKHFTRAGFSEEIFLYLNDCRSFQRWKWVMILELTTERVFRNLRLRYPELCLLGVYRKR